MKFINKIIIIGLLITILVCLVNIVTFVNLNSSDSKEVYLIREELSYNNLNLSNKDEYIPFTFNKDDYDKLSNINEDFIAYLAFEDELISEPIVQTIDNEYYLTHNFYKNENSQGTIFLDYLNKEEDRNLVLYGHNVFYDHTKKFSPLKKLCNQADYDNHKYFSIWSKRKKNDYQIAYIYYYDDEVDLFDYTQSNFNDLQSFNEFILNARNKNIIESNLDINYEDKFVTLQTCKSPLNNEKIIVVAKLISQNDY